MLHLFLFAAASTWTWWIEPCSQLVANSCVAADADLAAWALDAWSRATQGAIRFERVSDPKLARMKFPEVGGYLDPVEKRSGNRHDAPCLFSREIGCFRPKAGQLIIALTSGKPCNN